MRFRYLEYAQASSSGRDLHVTVDKPKLFRRGDKEQDLQNTERVIEIERELLRRWKAGDAEARLPDFVGARPPSSQDKK